MGLAVVEGESPADGGGADDLLTFLGLNWILSIDVTLSQECPTSLGEGSPCPIMNLSVRDAASLLKVSEKTIYRWIHQQVVPAYRVQEQYRFNRAELLEWATSRRLNVSSEIFFEPEAEGLSIPSLVAALEAGGVHYRVSGSDKPSALREVVQLLRLPEEVDREFLLRVILAREAIAPTAIGDGIAIPHVRNPVVLHVGRPSITLCFLDQAIEYGALDCKPVHTLFTIISPTTRAHLHLMSRLAFVLRDAEVRRAIERQESRPQLLREVARAEEQLASSYTPCLLSVEVGATSSGSS